jgi:hypothetical protein
MYRRVRSRVLKGVSSCRDYRFRHFRWRFGMCNVECVSDDLRVTSVEGPPRAPAPHSLKGVHVVPTSCKRVPAHALRRRTLQRNAPAAGSARPCPTYVQCVTMRNVCAWPGGPVGPRNSKISRHAGNNLQASWVALPHLRRVRFCAMGSCAVALWRRRGTAGAAREYGCDGCRRSCRFSCRRCFCRCCLGVAAAGAGADASATLAIATAAAKRRGGRLGLG